MSDLKGTARRVAVITLTVSIVIMTTDLIGMSLVAARHLEVLQGELSTIATYPGTERAGVMRSSKSRVAWVSEKYVGPAPRPGLFDHYRITLEGAGWRGCGHSIVRDT